MLIFSTSLPVVDDFDRMKFIELGVIWNQKSPTDALKGKEWDGKATSFRWEDEDKSFEVLSLDDITAIKFIKNDSGVIWSTEFILNSNSKRIGIYLSRSATENTIYFQTSFKPPYFLKLLYREKYLSTDNDLNISDRPIDVFPIDKDLQLLKELINENTDAHMLPIVYLTLDWQEHKYLVDPKRLARYLLGSAHVLVEKSNQVSRDLKDMCNANNVYNGGIEIFFPAQSADPKRYIPYDDANQDKVMDNIIKTIHRYMNQQKRERLDTWDGIQMMLLKRKMERLSEEKRNIENSLESDKEWEGLALALDQQVKNLTEQLEALQGENANLRAWTDSIGDRPLLFMGDETEFYKDETREFILRLIEQAINSSENKKDKRKRKIDVLQSVLEANDYEHIQEQRINQLKDLFKDYRTLTRKVRTALIDIGFKITDEGKHYKLTYYDDDRYVLSMPKTSSDCRAGKNFFQQLKEIIY